MTERNYLLRIENQWFVCGDCTVWRKNDAGYTTSLSDAALYTREEAEHHARPGVDQIVPWMAAVRCKQVHVPLAALRQALASMGDLVRVGDLKPGDRYRLMDGVDTYVTRLVIPATDAAGTTVIHDPQPNGTPATTFTDDDQLVEKVVSSL